MDLDPFALAYSYLPRSGRLDVHTRRQKAPRFMTEYDAYTITRRVPEKPTERRESYL